jgi:hypothetical protein
LIPIEAKYNQTWNGNIIRLPWWFRGTNIKKLLYKKSDYRTINELKYIISTQKVAVSHNATHLLTWYVILVLL